MAWLQFPRFSLTLTGAGTLPVSTKLVGPLSLLLIGRSLCSSAGLRFCKVPDQQPQPSSLLNGLGGPFPVRVVAVPAAARGTRAKAAMEPAAGSSWDRRALARRSRPGLSAASGDLGHVGPYEVRKEDEYFEDIADEKIPKDMLELASHIVETKSGHFEPDKFEDHYEDALKELLKKKQAGEKIEAPKERAPAKVINLMDALRRSVEAERGGSAKRQAPSAKARGSDSERPKKKKSR